jgi:hypothetical protein
VLSDAAVLTSTDSDSFLSRLLQETAWMPHISMVNGALIQTVRQVAEFEAVPEL